MSNRSQDFPDFLPGGRFRNRTDVYEVLEVNGNSLRVAYDDGREAVLNARIQRRIIQNLVRETATLEPYSGPDAPARNGRYFWSIGFLVSRITMMEAIVPYRARTGFAETYRQISGNRPSDGVQGYYVHGPEIDKWGNELRVTFEASSDELSNLDFGLGVEAVVNPSRVGSSWRINRNAFWWDLMNLGFRLGTVQDFEMVRNSIPFVYREEFDRGLLAASDD